MTLLLTGVVTAVATVLGMLSEEAEKTVRVAMTTMTQTIAVLKWRKLDIAKPAPTPLQGETLFPVPPKQAKTVQSEREQAESTCQYHKSSSLTDHTSAFMQELQ